MSDSALGDVILSEFSKVITAQSLVVDCVVIFTIFLCTMGVVYGFGRMFGLVNEMKSRNLLALSSMTFFSSFYIFILDIKEVPNWVKSNDLLLALYLLIPEISQLVVFILLNIVIYILLGMKLYSRLDNLQDRYIGEDDCSATDNSDILGTQAMKKKRVKRKQSK